SGATSLGLTESAKTGGQYEFLRHAAPENYVRIALSSATQRDETLVWFVDGASAAYDPSLDAKKMRNGYFEPGEERLQYLNISTQTGQDPGDYAINAISPLSCNSSLTLRITDVATGAHTLEFTDLQTLSLGYQVVLVDRYLSTEKTVSNGFLYEFEVSKDSASFAADRFQLRFVIAGSTYINSQVPPAVSIDSPCDRENLPVRFQTQANVGYRLFSAGVPVGEAVTGNGDFVTLNIPKNQLSEGPNKYDLEVSVLKGCDRFVYHDALTYDFATIDSVTVAQEGTTLSSNVQSGNQWYKDGEMIPNATDKILDVAESGTYSVEAFFGGCSARSADLVVVVDPFGEQALKAYPNPSSDKVTLVLPAVIDQDLKGIALHDLKGMRILDQDSNPELLKAGEKTLDLTHAESGVYILTISGAKKTYHLKIIRK
ncbi:MAG TPA: T9SS type A sorting domain-containing protein, partial [Chryseosolibacter sp.]